MKKIDIATTVSEKLLLLTFVLVCSATTTIPSVSADQGLSLNTSHGVRLLELEGGRNFRDLGGYSTRNGQTVKTGLLYRSGVLTDLTPEDYDTVAELDIATVVDLRATEERSAEPTFWQADPVEVMAWDYSMGLDDDSLLEAFTDPDLDAGQAERLMAALYRDMVTQQAPHYEALFDRLTESPDPLLFHCSAGKDRTGIGAALLLTALGVDRDTVIADYAVSEEILGDSLMEEPRSGDDSSMAMLDQLPEPAIEALMATRPAYLEAAFDEMRRHHGSVDAYIREALDVSEGQLRTLRSHYLE